MSKSTLIILFIVPLSLILLQIPGIRLSIFNFADMTAAGLLFTQKDYAIKQNILSTTSLLLSRRDGYRKQQQNNKSIDAFIKCKITERGVKLRWACPVESNVSKGYAPKGLRFDTHGANIGVIYTAGVTKGEYKITCIQGNNILAEATCLAK